MSNPTPTPSPSYPWHYHGHQACTTGKNGSDASCSAYSGKVHSCTLSTDVGHEDQYKCEHEQVTSGGGGW